MTRERWQQELRWRRGDHLPGYFDHGPTNPVCIAMRCPEASLRALVPRSEASWVVT